MIFPLDKGKQKLYIVKHEKQNPWGSIDRQRKETDQRKCSSARDERKCLPKISFSQGKE